MPTEALVKKCYTIAERPYKPRRAFLKRKAKSRVKKAKKRRRTQVDLWREWLVPDNAYHRYKGLRGIYWYWLSRYVRQDEWETWGKLCLTCLERIENWEEGDCGHVIASARCGEYLRFHRKNLTIQHKKCNNPKFSPNAGIFNALNYDRRHGQGSMEKLVSLMKISVKEPKAEEYRELIKGLPSYQQKLLSV